jgi:hypothetical protein
MLPRGWIGSARPDGDGSSWPLAHHVASGDEIGTQLAPGGGTNAKGDCMSSSKMVNDRYRSALLVAKIADVSADTAAERLNAAFGAPEDPAEPRPDWAGIMRLVGRTLLAHADRLVAADSALIKELEDDQEPRGRRERARGVLFQRLGSVRSLVRGIYGDTAVNRLGLSGPTPTEPIALHRLGKHLLDNLSLLETMVPVAEGGVLDIPTVRTRLGEEVGALGTAIDDLAREARERDMAQLQKDKIMDEYDVHFAFAARMLEGMLGSAGELGLAARVRPSTRKPGRVEDPGDDTEPVDGTAPIEEPGPVSGS